MAGPPKASKEPLPGEKKRLRPEGNLTFPPLMPRQCPRRPTDLQVAARLRASLPGRRQRHRTRLRVWGRGAAGGVRGRSLTFLVPIAEALQSDIDRDLHLLVYTHVLKPLGPGAATRATRSRAAPANPAAAAGSRRPRGDAARPGHGPEERVTPPRSSQACGLTAKERDSGLPGPPPGLDGSTDGALGQSHEKAPISHHSKPRRHRRH